MDNKVLAIIAVAVIAVAAVAGVIILMNGGEHETGVTYDGNGGKTSDGETSKVYSNTTAVECPFTNGNHQFSGWNTKADGTGTSYKVGNAVKEGMHLYAQWAPESYIMTIDYSNTGGPSSLNLSVFDAAGTRSASAPSIFLSVYTPCSISVTDGSGWTLNKDTGVFTGDINGKTFDLRFRTSSLTGGITDLDDNNRPMFAFNGVSGTSYSLSISLTTHR